MIPQRMIRLALVAAATSTAAVWIARAPAADEPAGEAAAPVPHQAAEAKLEAARRMQELMQAQRQAGLASAAGEEAYVWSRRLMEAERDAAADAAGRRAAFEGHVERMRQMRERAQALYKSAAAPMSESVAADFYLAEAELWLAQAGGE